MPARVPAQAEILWLMAAKTKWQDSEAKKQEAEAARKAGDEKRTAQLSQQSRELLEAARSILNSANVSNPGTVAWRHHSFILCRLYQFPGMKSFETSLAPLIKLCMQAGLYGIMILLGCQIRHRSCYAHWKLCCCC